MTNKKEMAQAILNASMSSRGGKFRVIAALRELVFELQYYQCCGDEGVEDMVLDARDILDVCDELENLK